MEPSRIYLILGDLFALLVTTIIGFATHGELNAGTRMLTAFLPAVAAWFLTAPWLGLFEPRVINNPRQLWRPLYAALLAAPWMALLRGVLLGSPVIPLFVLVFGLSSALGMLIWRGLWVILARRNLPS